MQPRCKRNSAEETNDTGKVSRCGFGLGNFISFCDTCTFCFTARSKTRRAMSLFSSPISPPPVLPPKGEDTPSGFLDRVLDSDWFDGDIGALCERVDAQVSSLLEFHQKTLRHVEEPSSVALPAGILCVSLLVLFAGARLFRVAAAFSAACFAFYVVYAFGRQNGDRITCEALLILSSVAALVAALAAGCIFKTGLFFAGATAMVFLIHLLFSAFPDLHTMHDQPLLAGKSLAYWGLILVAGVAGGLVLRWHSKPVLEVITSCVGGAGVGFSLRMVFEIYEAVVPNWVFLVCGVGATGVGIVAQRHARLRGCNRRKSNAERTP